MSLFRKIESIKAQIIETERMLEMVSNHTLMATSLREKLNSLRLQLNTLPQEVFEPKIELLFSGNAVSGSMGIKSSFVSKTIKPFQEMIKTQAALQRFGNVAKRGQAKHAPNTELYLTALPTGSFGVELTQLNQNDLFDEEEVAKAMKDVMKLIENASTSDEVFEAAIENVPKRSLTNLKKFLKEVADEKSIIKMECGEMGVEISKEKVQEAYDRVSEVIDENGETFVTAVFKGILLDSGKFEIQTEEGDIISGSVNEDLSENDLIAYDQTFLNRTCRVHLQVYRTRFKTGNEKVDYELLGIANI